MRPLRYIFVAAIAGFSVYILLVRDTHWYQSHFLANLFWPKQLDLVENQIAHTELLLSYSRDSRTNDQRRIDDAYRLCLSDLLSKREAVKSRHHRT